MDKETLIRITEELHQGAFDAKAYYLIMQQYRKNQHNYAEEMKVSPAFYHTVYDALMKACFMERRPRLPDAHGALRSARAPRKRRQLRRAGRRL